MIPFSTSILVLMCELDFSEYSNDQAHTTRVTEREKNTKKERSEKGKTKTITIASILLFYRI